MIVCIHYEYFAFIIVLRSFAIFIVREGSSSLGRMDLVFCGGQLDFLVYQTSH